MDFLRNMTHSILLIQYINLWSAVQSEQSGIITAYTVTLSDMGKADDYSRWQHELENVCKKCRNAGRCHSLTPTGAVDTNELMTHDKTE